MTILNEPVGDIIGKGVRSVWIRATYIRGANSGVGVVAPSAREFFVDQDTNMLITDDLDPGPAVVTIAGQNYDIVIPYSVSPVRLWPLINAHLDPPPPTATGFVKDGGGCGQQAVVTPAEYASIVRDPESLYFILED